ncbi:MAG: Gfo/Idh/MocA family oxidoreductase [Opitutaceae bacterium]
MLNPEHPAPSLPTVRIGMIGLGGRGRSLLRELLKLPSGIDIRALSDPNPLALENAAGMLKDAGRSRPELHCGGGAAWRSLCRNPDIDLVVIASPWSLHASQAVAAMEGGKHAFLEVPAAVTIDECWDLVATSERTARYCVILENCCFGRSEMAGLNMVRSGLLGELTHAECAYIHDLRTVLFDLKGEGRWRREPHTRINGNLYPTHGLGPVSVCLDLNRGDRIERIVSMSSPQRALAEAARSLPDIHPAKTEEFVCGDVNTTLIQTALGRTIMVQHDVVSPRPYSRINGMVGTRGSFFGFPDRLALDREGAHEWLPEDKLRSYLARFDSPLWKKQDDGAVTGGHGGMDFVMMSRLIESLQIGRYPDIDVYDAVAWSSVFPLSVASVGRRSEPVLAPDFTRDRWKTNKRIFLPEV